MPVIDKVIFEELKQMSGANFINELIDAFLEDAPHMIQTMQTAAETGDVETFRRNAHSLKSNAYTFGAAEIGRLARELEVMGRENNLAIWNKVEVLNQEFEMVAQELRGLRI